MLLQEITDLRKYVVVGSELSMSSINPSKDDAILKFFNRFFTDALITQLNSYKNETGVKKTAFDLAENALAKFTMYQYLIPGQLRVQDGSVSRIESENSKTAYKNQISDNREEYYESGFNYLNQLISLMESNAGVFSEWANSPLKKRFNLLLIKSAPEFDNYYQLHHSFTTFMSIINQQILGIDLFLKAKFSATLIDELITSTSLSNEKQKFKDYCCKSLANFTIKSALQTKIVSLSSYGITVLEKDKDTSTVLEKTPDLSAISSAINSADENSKRYIDLAYTYMYENPSAFGITTDKPTFTKTQPWV